MGAAMEEVRLDGGVRKFEGGALVDGGNGGRVGKWCGELVAGDTEAPEMCGQVALQAQVVRRGHLEDAPEDLVYLLVEQCGGLGGEVRCVDARQERHARYPTNSEDRERELRRGFAETMEERRVFEPLLFDPLYGGLLIVGNEGAEYLYARCNGSESRRRCILAKPFALGSIKADT